MLSYVNFMNKSIINRKVNLLCWNSFDQISVYSFLAAIIWHRYCNITRKLQLLYFYSVCLCIHFNVIKWSFVFNILLKCLKFLKIWLYPYHLDYLYLKHLKQICCFKLVEWKKIILQVLLICKQIFNKLMINMNNNF